MKDRIRLLMEDQHLTQQSFAQLLEISPAQLSGIYNGRTKPTLNIVDAIHRKFPQVRTEWLLYGILPMYINNVQQTDGEDATGEGTQPAVGGLVFDFADEKNDPSGASSASATSLSSKTAGSQMAQGSLFEQPQMHGVNHTPKNGVVENAKYIDKHQRKITEIRIFYDDQTWETFVPKK